MVVFVYILFKKIKIKCFNRCNASVSKDMLGINHMYYMIVYHIVSSYVLVGV